MWTELSDSRLSELNNKLQLGQLGPGSSSSSREYDMNHRLPAAAKHKQRRKRKSGRERTTEDFVRQDVLWPHHGVYKGPKHTVAKYSTLTVPGFVFGCWVSFSKILLPSHSLSNWSTSGSWCKMQYPTHGPMCVTTTPWSLAKWNKMSWRGMIVPPFKT